MTTQVGARGHGEDPVSEETTHLGGYRLVQVLGEGGMGVVHLALDRSGRAVAIKLLRPHIGHDPVARARLAREVETLERIRHPGVAPVLDAHLDGSRPYIVTRFVDGLPLDEVVAADGPLDGPHLLRLGRGLALAIRAIHQAGVVHRDIKPGNVLVIDSGDPVLIDFGIAHITDDVRITSTGLVMGTPGYLSPEIVEGAQVTEATDWWGWAATVAYAALGRPPFGGGPMEAVLSRVTGGHADLAGIDPRLAPLLAAALTPDATQRPSVDEVLAGLEVYARGGHVTQVIDVPAARTQVIQAAPPARPAAAPVPQRRPLQEEFFGGPDHSSWATDEVEDEDEEQLEPSSATDPRIGRPNRSGVLGALLALIVAGFAAAPVVTALAVLVWFVVARTADRSVTSLVLRRHASGIRRSDLPVAVASGPWHLVVAVVASTISVLLPGVVLVATTVSTALGLSAATGGPVEPARSVPLAVGALFAALTAWWGPMGAGLRRGTRSVVRGLTRSSVARQVLVGAALVGATALAGWVVTRGGAPTWTPGSGAPRLGLPFGG
jgi:serine/threonine protein kinase